ncbi:MAG: hypothetical protein MUE44_12690 [Oscillatoriaceae cyanobacterium Prado104]|jgi:hypothetical protein|nr:hypothetical protein [Oscillatoriaceae cyanobacterium Prado104]
MIDEVKLVAILQAIAQVRTKILWKPGKATSHLFKRIRLGHLPDDSSLEQYNAIITAIVNSPEAKVYVYVYGETIYPTLVANMDNKLWLVMISLEGVLETAFPPDRPEIYLANSAFVYLGSVKELQI